MQENQEKVQREFPKHHISNHKHSIEGSITCDGTYNTGVNKANFPGQERCMTPKSYVRIGRDGSAQSMNDKTYEAVQHCENCHRGG